MWLMNRLLWITCDTHDNHIHKVKNHLPSGCIKIRKEIIKRCCFHFQRALGVTEAEGKHFTKSWGCGWHIDAGKYVSSINKISSTRELTASYSMLKCGQLGSTIWNLWRVLTSGRVVLGCRAGGKRVSQTRGSDGWEVMGPEQWNKE
jgi:hypothetical protein